MHILFISDNFPPEANAPASRTFEHVKIWVELGHTVTVITGVPNFPKGEVFEGYKNRLYQVEFMSGIRVVRVLTFIVANRGLFRRTLDYASFMLTASIAGMFQPRPDIVVATSPQFFTAIAGWLVSTLRRRPSVLEIRDMWPDSIVAVQAIDENRLIKTLRILENFLYRKATSVVTVTESFKEQIEQKGIESNKLHVVHNGVDSHLFYKRNENCEIKARLNCDGKFLVGYIGTHGMAHALDKVLEAVGILSEYKDVHFLFVGAGAVKSNLEEQARLQKLDNVTLIDQVPRTEVPDYMSACSICLVPLRNTPVFESVIPSKIFECMALGVPLILSLPEGEASQLVQKHNIGLTVQPEDPDEMASAILKLYENPDLMQSFSVNSRRASKLFSRKAMAVKMLDVFNGVTKK